MEDIVSIIVLSGSLIFFILLMVFFGYCMWRLFEKAGRPGWEAIVPFYSLYILITKIAKKEGWWMLLMFVPFVSLVAVVIIYMSVAKNFGKSDEYGIGLALLTPIFLPMLALGDDQFIAGENQLEEVNAVE